MSGNDSSVLDVLQAAANGFTGPIPMQRAHDLVAESSNGVTQAHRESHAHRLLNAMERYARAALTEAAEIDFPLDDEESDE